jgi:nucleotide-binding universal stress UspA family protein
MILKELTRPGAARAIIVAVDDSEPATFAVRAAAALAKDLGASLVLVHVISPTAQLGNDDAYLATGLHDLSRGRARDLLVNAAAAVPESVSVETALLEGSPVAEIVRVARERGADYVVIGTHGRGRFGQLIVGSVAAGVARSAPCPVVTVSHAPPQRARAAVALVGESDLSAAPGMT